MRKTKIKKSTAEKPVPVTEKKVSKKTKVSVTDVKAEDTFIAIDFPRNNAEILFNAGYAIRISASECEVVEISINDGEWQPCRNASGYWWFDWNITEPGRYKMYARMRGSGGRETVSKRRLCKVA